LRRDDLNQEEVLLPPYNEQKRIAEKIEELFSKIDNGIQSLRKVKKQLNHYRQSVLKAAVEGKLTQEWREENRDSLESADQLLEHILQERRERWEEQYRKKYEDKGKDLPKNWKSRYSEPESPDESDLNELPSGWRWITIEQLADVETGATPLRSESEYWENGTIPWITSSVVNQSKVKSADEYTTKKALKETNIKYFPKGTIVMAMYGEGKTRGKFTELDIEATTNQACAGIITQDTGRIVKPFLKLFLKYNYERIRLKASGGVQPNLNLGIIRSIDLPLPPLKEQQEIVGRAERILSVIEQHENVVNTELKRASKIKQSILKKAFQGNLVYQDPDDEPAGELLRRINSEGENVDQQVEMGL
jgi:type I restriction enzyme S subunit